MRAVILAAGMGKRLGRRTAACVKCMVEVCGVSMIDRVLAQLAETKVKHVTVVTGYKEETLKDFIGSRYCEKLTIDYINNPRYDTTNNIYSLYLAKEILAADDTLLIESDIVMKDGLLKDLIDFPASDAALVSKYRPWMDGTVVTKNEQDIITQFIARENFVKDDSATYYKTVNVYKLSRNLSSLKYLPALERYREAHGDNDYYERVLGEIVSCENAKIHVLETNETQWHEIDNADDLAQAEQKFSIAREQQSMAPQLKVI